jgi:N6-adenosine-specific RNA methylase IME4
MPKFQVIVADPPWAFKDTIKMSDVARGAQANYATMTISQIKQLPVKGIVSDDGAVLALWVPSSLLQEGLDTMKAWGFSHKQTYVWVKTKYDPSWIFETYSLIFGKI